MNKLLIDPKDYLEYWCNNCKKMQDKENIIILVAECFEQDNGDIIQVPNRCSCPKCFKELDIRDYLKGKGSEPQ